MPTTARPTRTAIVALLFTMAPRKNATPAPQKSPVSNRCIILYTVLAPSRTDTVRMFDNSSPLMSGTSFINAMTSPNTAKYKLDKRHRGSFKRHPRTLPALLPYAAALAWAKKPALMTAPRTDTMQNAARSGKRLSRNGARLYRVPRNADIPRAMFRPSVANAGLPTTPITNDKTKERITVIVAPLTDKSPAAMGRFGLLILSISTSVIWFRPVMYKFMSRAGTMAYTMLQVDRTVRASA
mmetsp:Transcript_17343/g.43278  ORF Transcript_17343/g.43278 Transcript_17343/m.43278 type:complete len:240 (+) Transcript_17343:533-1252(+)